MAGGLVALLDDVATLAKLAASSLDDVGAAAGRAGAKAAGVVVDDAAVTPSYVQGFLPERELPAIRRIATGSMKNKLLFILPAALLLSEFAPWVLTPLLMLGGTYLCYEGAEKVWEKLSGHDAAETRTPAVIDGPESEEQMVSGAIRTDFILSAEIMVIALNEVASEPLLSRAAILLLVAVVITVLVYGVVGLIVKMDDIGLRLVEGGSGISGSIGQALVKGAPVLLKVLGIVGTAAMLWVGGHILLVGADELGWHTPYELVHHAEEVVTEAVSGIGDVLGWLINTAGSAIIGLGWGAVVVAVVHMIRRNKGAAAH